jgi:hypothetical protein
MTDMESFAGLEPSADGFRNYFGDGNCLSPPETLVDRASRLTLTIPEMAVLVGGMRVLNANAGQSSHGVFTHRPGISSAALPERAEARAHLLNNLGVALEEAAAAALGEAGDLPVRISYGPRGSWPSSGRMALPGCREGESRTGVRTGTGPPAWSGLAPP